MVQEKVSWIPLRDKKKTAYLGVYLALALICSYVESLIPFYFGIPGVKLGLTNIVVVLMLYCVGTKEALAVSGRRTAQFPCNVSIKKDEMVWRSACQCERWNFSQCRTAYCGSVCC